MVRAPACIAVMLALAACDNSTPAGGQGYFDPPPPAPLATAAPFPPIPGAAPTAAAATGPGGASDPNSQLALDVRQTLASTPIDPETGQPIQAAPTSGDIGINPNDDSINLALQTQEEQKRQREIAAAQRQAAQQQLVVIEPEPVPQQDINANVVQFARDTSHPVGTKVYNRPAFRDRLQSNSVCRRFDSADEAQRQFLTNGGPTTDRFNLDPDGDGFACGFDPEVYRKLNF